MKSRNFQSIFSALRLKMINSHKRTVKIVSIMLFLLLFLGCVSYVFAYDIRSLELFIQSPEENAYLSGDVMFQAEVQAHQPIYKVTIYFNETFWQEMEQKSGTLNEGVFTYTLQSQEFQDGSYNILIKGLDTFGNYKTESLIVTIDNTPPELVLSYPSPKSNFQLSGEHQLLKVCATDTMGIELVKFKVDDGTWENMIYDSRSQLYEATLNTTKYTKGNHNLSFHASDRAGNTKSVDYEIEISHQPEVYTQKDISADTSPKIQNNSTDSNTSSLDTLNNTSSQAEGIESDEVNEPRGDVTKGPGDSVGEAIEITEGATVGTLPGSSSYNGIWYKIYLSDGDIIEAYLWGPGDTDFDMDFYDTDGSTYLDGAYGVTYPDSFLYIVSTDGYYFIHVYPYDGSGSFTLDLNIRIPGENPNNAISIGGGTTIGTLPGPSVDNGIWYKIYLSAGMNIDASLTGPGGTDFDMGFYDTDGSTLLTYATGVTYPDTFSYTVSTDGYYYIHVYPHSGSGSFTLEITIPVTTKAWTFLVYIAADNNLEDAGIEDINEMEVVGSTADINVIVQIDRISGYDSSNGDWTGTRRYYITQDSDTSTINSLLVQDLGEMNMADPNVLIDFTSWAIQNYPADRYCLVLWDHGSGWRSVLSEDSKGVCWDDTTGTDYLTTAELEQALSTIQSITGVTIDILGFDACLMATIEVAYQVMDYASIMVGSEETEPWDGWPYDPILQSLANDPSMTPSQLATEIVTEYIAFYGSSSGETLSAIDLSYIDALATSISNFAQELINGLSTYGSEIIQSRILVEEFDDAVDIYHFTQLIYASITDSAIQNSADQLMNALLNAMIAEEHGSGRPNANGITAYFPESSSWYDPLYESIISFTSAVLWDEFLNQYYLMPPPQGSDPASAIEITEGTTIDSLPGPSVDNGIWYTIHLSSGEPIYVSLTGPGGTDFDMDFFDTDGTTLLDGAYGVAYPDSFLYTVSTDGYYFIHVYPYSGSGGFTLDITLTNTPTGDDIEVTDPGTGITVTFESVTSIGLTIISTSDSGPSPPSGFEVAGQYYEIVTTASYTGTIEIAIPYDEGQVSGDESDLQLMHWNSTSGQWEDVTTWVDTPNNIIYGDVTSLSTFAVIMEAPSGGNGGGGGGDGGGGDGDGDSDGDGGDGDGGGGDGANNLILTLLSEIASSVTPGTNVNVTLSITDSSGKKVEGANVTIDVGDVETLLCKDAGDGIYKCIIDTNNLSPDTYLIVIKATKSGYPDTSTSFSLTIRSKSLGSLGGIMENRIYMVGIFGIIGSIAVLGVLVALKKGLLSIQIFSFKKMRSYCKHEKLTRTTIRTQTFQSNVPLIFFI